jgi:tetratricopeptide (TPR) repeat protein
VNKKNSKYLFIFTTLIIFIGLLNSGCFQLNEDFLRKDPGKKSGSQEERMSELEEKVATLSYSLGSLTTENYELKKNLNEQETVKSQLIEEYTQIKNKQAALDKTQASNNITRNHLKRELAETKVALEKIKQHLTEMESEKNNLNAKLEILEATRVIDTQTEVAVDKTANIKAEKGHTDQSKKNLIKEVQEQRKSSLVEDLLDKAIRLYREGHFEDAIEKWEEILVLDPSKLEAKFNIEIAQDRIKEKQIQKDLDSTRIQKNR